MSCSAILSIAAFHHSVHDFFMRIFFAKLQTFWAQDTRTYSKALNKPQKMSSTTTSSLTKSPLFSTFSGNILTIVLQTVTDLKFACPCDTEMNTKLTGLIFSSFSFHILALMLCLYFRYVMSEEDKKKSLFNILNFLFPPILWIILLLFDGDYIACSKTDWNGEYVLDDKLNIKWCKPTELIPGRNETELQNLTLSFIYESQVSHFVSSD